jgi:quercetin dioxygenase-like cupin family protein
MMNTESLPWIPLGPGESFKPLHFGSNGRARALLLRVEQGTIIPRHRHLGDVHAFNLTGQRQLDTGEIVGPGGYVYEPVGNVDSWMAIGDEPVIVHIVSTGAMEYLGDDDQVLRRDTGSTLRDLYIRHCKEHGITPMELG